MRRRRSNILARSLPASAKVNLTIHNTLGQKVAELVSEYQNAGFYKVNWDASELSSGLYYYTLKAGHFVNSRKMLLIK